MSKVDLEKSILTQWPVWTEFTLVDTRIATLVLSRILTISRKSCQTLKAKRAKLFIVHKASSLKD